MKIALTGATGFLGSHVARHLIRAGHKCRCWHRPQSNLGRLFDVVSDIEWVPGSLTDNRASMTDYLRGTDALVHAALDRPGAAFRGGEGDLEQFAARNIVGSLRLFEAAREAGVGRVIFVSTCAVHEKILDDRPLDEAHPLWASSHYGAHKAAIEAFVHSFGLSGQLDICAIRPCGIYGVAEPIENSKWFDLVRAIANGEPVECTSGGKVVHVTDVASAIELLLHAKDVSAESFNCCDQYVAEWDVATIAKELAVTDSVIGGASKSSKHRISTEKIEKLGMEFGGNKLVRETVSQLLDAARA